LLRGEAQEDGVATQQRDGKEVDLVLGTGKGKTTPCFD
jgi:hypothetical protein